MPLVCYARTRFPFKGVVFVFTGYLFPSSRTNLRGDEGCHLFSNRAMGADDSLTQQPREDVVRALAP